MPRKSSSTYPSLMLFVRACREADAARCSCGDFSGVWIGDVPVARNERVGERVRGCICFFVYLVVMSKAILDWYIQRRDGTKQRCIEKIHDN